MTDMATIRKGLRMLNQGLSELLQEYKLGDQLSPTEATAVRAKLVQHDQNMATLRRTRRDIYAALRNDIDEASRLKLELLRAMGEGA